MVKGRLAGSTNHQDLSYTSWITLDPDMQYGGHAAQSHSNLGIEKLKPHVFHMWYQMLISEVASVRVRGW